MVKEVGEEREESLGESEHTSIMGVGVFLLFHKRVGPLIKWRKEKKKKTRRKKRNNRREREKDKRILYIYKYIYIYKEYF